MTENTRLHSEAIKNKSIISDALKKVLAFTLAETLIVMGVIGVVSALTIPNLNASTANKEKIAKVKKLYQNLDDAAGRAQAVYGPVDQWFTGKSTDAERYKVFYERVSEFLKVQKTCVPKATGCFSRNTMNALNSGYSIGDEVQKYYQVILADGASVSFYPYVGGGSDDYSFNLYVDIDGPTKGNFTAGKDAFLFVGTKANGLNPYWGVRNTDDLTSCFKFGNTCSGWVLKYDNMDYLNAGIDGKCKNNTSLVLNSFANPPVTACK